VTGAATYGFAGSGGTGGSGAGFGTGTGFTAGATGFGASVIVTFRASDPQVSSVQACALASAGPAAKAGPPETITSMSWDAPSHVRRAPPDPSAGSGIDWVTTTLTFPTCVGDGWQVYMRPTLRRSGATNSTMRPIATVGTGCPDAACAGVDEADATSNAEMQIARR
jgi:hypothetical protein